MFDLEHMWVLLITMCMAKDLDGDNVPVQEILILWSVDLLFQVTCSNETVALNLGNVLGPFPCLRGVILCSIFGLDILILDMQIFKYVYPVLV